MNKCLRSGISSDESHTDRSTSYLDLLLDIDSKGQLRTELNDKRDDFNIHIAKFPKWDISVVICDTDIS
jgi:hypothetical protein